MCFGWLKVILDEGALRPGLRGALDGGLRRVPAAGVDEFPLERVAAITGCDPERIAAAARPVRDQHPGGHPVRPRSPTSSATPRPPSGCTARSAPSTGSLDVPGGELMHGFHPDVVSESELELHEALGAEQKAKQLGADTHRRLHLPGDGEARRARPAGMGARVPEHRLRLLHGQSDRDVPGHGDRGALPRQGVLHPREQHPDGVRQHAGASTRGSSTRTSWWPWSISGRRPRSSPTSSCRAMRGPNGRASPTASAGPRFHRPSQQALAPAGDVPSRCTTSGAGSRYVSASGSTSRGRRWKRCSTTGSRSSA